MSLDIALKALNRIALNIYGDTPAPVIAGEAVDAIDAAQAAAPVGDQPDTSQTLALHRQPASERRRADQGWDRYESTNRDRNDLRERLAAPSIPAAEGVRMLTETELIGLNQLAERIEHANEAPIPIGLSAAFALRAILAGYSASPVAAVVTKNTPEAVVAALSAACGRVRDLAATPRAPTEAPKGGE